MKEKNYWIHKKLEKRNTKESMIFWKQYQRILLSDDENFIGNLQNDNENQSLCLSDTEKEKLLYETFWSGKHLKDQQFDEKHYDLVLNNFEQDPQDQHNSQTKDGVNLNDEITTSEVKAAIKAQKITGKSRDGDNFHPKMLKTLNIDTCKYLSELFNSCLQSG